MAYQNTSYGSTAGGPHTASAPGWNPPPPGQQPPYPPPAGAPHHYPPADIGYQQPAGSAGSYPPPGGQAYPAGQAPPPQAGAAVGPLPQMPAGMPSAPASEDVMDDPNAKPPAAPSAPPLEKMDAIPGYNNIGFDAANYLPPPSYEDVMASRPPQEQRAAPRQYAHTEESARTALIEHATDKCCWGTSAAKNMVVRDLRNQAVFHYTLETFGEARSTAWAFEPYKGGIVDTPANGPAPGPWDIHVTPKQLFVNSVVHQEVPHTASIKPCHDCFGMGRKQCYRCLGRGRVRCSFCGGSGFSHHHHHHHNHHNDDRHHHHHHHRENRCTWCHGNGRRSCDTCFSQGLITCSTCKGTANLKCFIKLTVKWTNHFEDKIQQDCALPQDLIRKVSGDIAFQEEHPMVWPINHFPDDRINVASRQLVEKHRTAFPSERILKQKQVVRNIPITEVIYELKGETDSYWVYGRESLVFAPGYPQQCCCGCVIL